jgi:hypothetical protein
MPLNWFRTGDAARVGGSLAEGLVVTREGHAPRVKEPVFQRLLQRIDQEARPLKLGWIGRARLASAFKRRLREAGVDQGTVDDLTNVLLMHLMQPVVVESDAAVQSPGQSNRAIRPGMPKQH